MKDVDLLLARAQVGLAFFFALVFAATLILLFMGVAGITDLSDAAMQLLVGMAGVIGTIVTLQQNYFFARHRAPTIEPTPSPTPTAR
jgi:hypothetical protein